MLENDFVGGWWSSTGYDFWLEISEPEIEDMDESPQMTAIFRLGHETILKEKVFQDEAMTAIDSLIRELEHEHPSITAHIDLIGFNSWEDQVNNVLQDFQEIIDYVWI